jgi:hypothetical protein
MWVLNRAIREATGRPHAFNDPGFVLLSGHSQRDGLDRHVPHSHKHCEVPTRGGNRLVSVQLYDLIQVLRHFGGGTVATETTAGRTIVHLTGHQLRITASVGRASGDEHFGHVQVLADPLRWHEGECDFIRGFHSPPPCWVWCGAAAPERLQATATASQPARLVHFQIGARRLVRQVGVQTRELIRCGSCLINRAIRDGTVISMTVVDTGHCPITVTGLSRRKQRRSQWQAACMVTALTGCPIIPQLSRHSHEEAVAKAIKRVEARPCASGPESEGCTADEGLSGNESDRSIDEVRTNAFAACRRLQRRVRPAVVQTPPCQHTLEWHHVRRRQHGTNARSTGPEREAVVAMQQIVQFVPARANHGETCITCAVECSSSDDLDQPGPHDWRQRAVQENNSWNAGAYDS